MKWLLALAVAAVCRSGEACVTQGQPLEPVRAEVVKARSGLPNVYAKLRAGKEVRIAYFGGSITAQEGWRVKTLKWLRDSYPQAKIVEINAAIGGTGSDLGVYRCRKDVLDHKPDLVFVEFAVNDSGADPKDIWRAMEGIVRQAWRQDPSIDICYVYTYVTGFQQELEKGICPRAASADEILADHYGIPSINVALRASELVRERKLIGIPQKDSTGKDLPTPAGVTLFSTDGVHPLDAGHEIYAQAIDQALADMARTARPRRHRLPKPLMPDNWENAKLVPLQPSMLSAGWRKVPPDDGLARAFHDRLPEIWEAAKPGERITFRLRGTGARIYDLMGPDAGIAVCTVDGQPVGERSRFDVFCTYHRLAQFSIADGLPRGVHEVTVEVSPREPDRSAVLDQEKAKPGFDPARYQGTVLRVGYLMLLGDLVHGG